MIRHNQALTRGHKGKNHNQSSQEHGKENMKPLPMNAKEIKKNQLYTAANLNKSSSIV